MLDAERSQYSEPNPIRPLMVYAVCVSVALRRAAFRRFDAVEAGRSMPSRGEARLRRRAEGEPLTACRAIMSLAPRTAAIARPSRRSETHKIGALESQAARGVKRADDRRVLNGVFWVLRSGSPWADAPERYGPRATLCNRFNRWRKAGVWDRLMDAIVASHDGGVQMIDTCVVREAGTRRKSTRSSTSKADRSSSNRRPARKATSPVRRN